jgi:hypothetical protein
MRHAWHKVTAAAIACAVLAACSAQQTRPSPRTFKSPEDAVKALDDAASRSDLAAVVAIFGPDGRDLIDSSDPVTARQSREVFAAAMAEGWRLMDEGNRKTLVVGAEGWPFPVPLVSDAGGWRFDTAAGKEEILSRRIGRNELSVIQICRTYVAAQRLYAQLPHDSVAAGTYAASFASEPGRHNGLYWVAVRGQSRSPLGDLMSDAAEDGRGVSPRRPPTPFHGYYFRILTGQGNAAPGGAREYLTDGRMTGGFALVAWPARYDYSGVMTFMVNQDGTVYQKDIGAGTGPIAEAMNRYDPDASWTAVE